MIDASAKPPRSPRRRWTGTGESPDSFFDRLAPASPFLFLCRERALNTRRRAPALAAFRPFIQPEPQRRRPGRGTLLHGTALFKTPVIKAAAGTEGAAPAPPVLPLSPCARSLPFAGAARLFLDPSFCASPVRPHCTESEVTGARAGAGVGFIFQRNSQQKAEARTDPRVE
jgi:hypothetical protein